MHIKVLSTASEFDAISVEWRALEALVPFLLPFQTYDWNRSWWQIFSVQTVFRRDELSIIVFYDKDQLVAVAPYAISYLGRKAFSVYRYVRPFGADPNLTEIRTPLILPGYEKDVFQHLAAPYRPQLSGFTEQQMIVSDENGEQLFTQRCAMRQIDKRKISNYVLDLGKDWDSFRSGLKRNIKESIRHCYNSLARDKLQPVLKVVTGHQALPEHLPTFYHLHSSRASAQLTVEHPDYFSNPLHKALIASLLKTPFADKMQLFCLEIDGKIVAIRMGFLMGEELYLYYSGYDLAYARYSVMTTLLVEIIRWSLDKNIQRLNLSVGEDVSKTRWGPRVISYAEYQFVKNAWWRYRLGKSIVQLRKRRQTSMLGHK